MHGLQAVAHVGQRAAHDHAHGVIEVGALHLVVDGNQLDVAGRLVPARAAGAFIVRIGQGWSFLKRSALSREAAYLMPLRQAVRQPRESN